MKYWVRYEETSVLYHPIEANTDREAIEKFEAEAQEGKVKFSRMDTIKTVITAEKDSAA